MENQYGPALISGAGVNAERFLPVLTQRFLVQLATSGHYFLIERTLEHGTHPSRIGSKGPVGARARLQRALPIDG